MIRPACPEDLDALWRIEKASFDPVRRTTRNALRHALMSRHQRVWVAGDPVEGFLVAWLFPKALRIYDVAVAPGSQGTGVGHALLERALDEAQRRNATRVLLEADASLDVLVTWYKKRGFTVRSVRQDFYGPGRDAVRMERPPPYDRPPLEE